MSPEISARLAAVGIQWFWNAKGFSLVWRDRCAAFLHGESIGSSGLITENGLAFLVWREEQPFLVAKGNEVSATREQVELLQRFSEDLKKALLAADERR